MFHLYQKNGAWKLKGQDHLWFTTQEEAINATVQIGGQLGLQEFNIVVEVPEEVHQLSPYESILGFAICERCKLHPCEC